MLHYDKIDMNKGIDTAKSTECKECMICHYWFFNNASNFVCNGCHYLTVLCLNLTILLLTLLKRLIIIVLIMTLANLKQFVC